MRIGHPAFALILSVLLCTVGYVGALIAMGGVADYKLLPMLIVVVLVVADTLLTRCKFQLLAQQNANVSRKAFPKPDQIFIATIPIVMTYSLVLPAAVSASATFVHSINYHSASLISSGPVAKYVVRGQAIGTMPDMASSIALTNAAIDKMQSLGPRPAHFNVSIEFDASMEYVMLADGMKLLRQIPNIETYGIVSNGIIFDFSLPLMSPPVISFPVWPTDNLEYFTNSRPLDDDIDLVMISRDIPNLGLFSDRLFHKMKDDFIRCGNSTIWTLYVRKTLTTVPCWAMEY